MKTGIVKNIRLFFLILAVSFLNIHMIIPHDHHPVDSDLCNENLNPVSKTATHHPGFPGHCHAFNALALEKVNTYHINKHAPVCHLIQGCIFKAKIADLQLSRSKFVGIIDQPVIKGLPGLSSLRAPPVLG